MRDLDIFLDFMSPGRFVSEGVGTKGETYSILNM